MSKEAITAITSAFSADEVWETSSYTAFVNGGSLDIEILDSHDSGSKERYIAVVSDPEVPEDEQEMNENGLSMGEPAGSIRDALSNVNLALFKRR